MKITKTAYLWGLFKEFSVVLGGGVGRRRSLIYSVLVDNEIIQGTQKDTHCKCPVATTNQLTISFQLLFLKCHVRPVTC